MPNLMTRMMQMRAQTIDEEARTIEAAIATESAVEVWDWRNGEIIDEVLLISGARFGSQVPLLATHDSYSLDSVLGSIRNLRTEDTELVGRLFFASDDEQADRVWNKVRQNHLTDISVGYRIDPDGFVEIQPGQSATVAGREWKADKRIMRIVTGWEVREGSVVSIGADQGAKMREAAKINSLVKGKTMNKQLREYLESIGLRSGTSDEEAEEFYEALKGNQRLTADEIKDGTREPPLPDPTPGDRSPEGTGDRQDSPPADQRQEDPAAVAQRAISEERDRVRQINELAGDDVPRELAERAVSEGWDLARTQGEFLRAIREGRQDSVGPAIHVRDSDRNRNVRSLAAGMLIGQGLDPTGHRLHDGEHTPRRADQLTEQDADLGDEFCRLAAIDIIRECARLDTGRYHRDPQEAMRAATSGGTLSYVFSTSVYARLIAAWETIGDTTVGWCDEEDVANFQTQEDISLQANARLEGLPRGDEAKHATVSDNRETYKIARYAKQFVVDEQDIIDDRLGAIMRMPAEMGEAARQLRPDLVYSLMLENPDLTDTGAVFNSTAVTTAGGHANLGTAALGSTALKAAISAMVQQRLNRTSTDPGHALTLRPRFLIVPAALEWTARELTAAAALAKLFADSSDPYYAQLNLLAQEGIRVVVDDRIGAIGVLDPRTSSARTGLDTNWFLTAGGRQGLRVAYRRGTNRQPVMRSFTLDKGQWGVGWDINLDIGATFLDYRPWYESTGAGE